MVVSQARSFRSVYSPEIWLGFLAGSGGLIPHVQRKLTSRLLIKAAGGVLVPLRPSSEVTDGSLQARSLSLQGWGLIDLPLRATFSPAHPLARRDVPSSRARAFRFSHFGLEGNSQTVLHCAHRTSTVSSCAFCEQEGWSDCSPPTFGGRALREHGDRPGYPAPFSASC